MSIGRVSYYIAEKKLDNESVSNIKSLPPISQANLQEGKTYYKIHTSYDEGKGKQEKVQFFTCQKGENGS